MCLPAITAANIGAYTLGVAAVGTAASIGMGIMSARQQAAQAQASLNYQAAAEQRSLEMQRQGMLQQQQQQRDALLLQQKQAIANRDLQVTQAHVQQINQYNQQRQQVLNERINISARHLANKNIYQQSVEQAKKQAGFNNQAANRAYVAEQNKLTEARKKAAFEQQTILAKAIGSKGTILAAGRTGQSVGLLARDVERQKGFAQAQVAATLDSQRDASIIAMEGAWLQNQSANNQALSNIGYNPPDPYLPDLPQLPKFVGGIGLAIDSPYAAA